MDHFQEKKIPIIKIGSYLIVSIQVDMHDKLALQLQSQILNEIEKTGAKGVLIDISVLEMVDSFIGRMLSGMASMASIMDAAVVIVGMQPAVAITLVELGLEMPGVDTALNMERGMELLERRMASINDD
ncbi:MULTISPECIES: STAS domain-containing protein [unclassified Lentimicrobium]|uniref:STAS domain-containing protein n=1 Tax=unclassified Lentimicrobium TaxID=2677434 RepID=UPI0015539478|nr:MULTISPECIES: STAS domain-containing protein [unclassified Lentimicrobium]NPD45952.1 STAS domain-containing protein [Lentimicrobium sp. S6]NPD84281.1 STAS domain-containing protein [Lentimicrobium sp. L6]